MTLFDSSVKPAMAMPANYFPETVPNPVAGDAIDPTTGMYKETIMHGTEPNGMLRPYSERPKGHMSTPSIPVLGEK